MVEYIELDNITLEAFAGAPSSGAPSEVFNVKRRFEKGRSYLVEAGSGRGKSSLCSFLCGLRSDYAGTIILGGPQGRVELATCDKVELRKSVLGVMFQDYKLFSELSAVENVMLKSRLTGFATEADVRGMLARLGLDGHADRPCAKLSLGQQQRVAFVRALVQPCDFILLDEPVSHLDEENAIEMSRMLRERQLRDKVGVIVTSIGYRLPYEYDEILNL